MQIDYRSLVEHAPDVIVLIDGGGRVLFANDRVEPCLGYRPKDICGRSALELVHPDDMMAAALGLHDTVRGAGLSGAIPVRMRHADGSWVQFDIDGCRLPGEVTGVVVVARRRTDIEDAAAELQRIGALLRNQHETSPDGILIVAGNSDTLSYNRRFLELWGLDDETAQSGYERRAEAVRTLLKDPSGMIGLVDRIYEDPYGTFDLNVDLVDGRTLEAHTLPLLGPDGGFYARIWYYRDITDRIRADEELVANEERYRRLVELSPNGIAVHQGGVLRYINTTGARMFGRPAAELVGMNVFSFVNPEDVASVIQAAMQGDFSVPEFVEVRMQTAEGEDLFVEIASAGTTFNGAAATQSVFRDVTDRRRAEIAMRESEERYRSLVESSPDPVFVHDGKTVIYANPAAASLLGFSRPGQLMGLDAFEVLRGIPRAEWMDRVNRVLAGETLRVSERCFLVYAGREAELDMALSPATFSGNRCVQVLIRDVTEIRRAERGRLELERKILEAQKLESLGVLAGGVAHDFNNLLVAIMGNASLAHMELTSNPTAAASYLRDVETAAMRAADLARQMLAYSGKGSFVLEPIDLSSLVMEMTSLLGASMPRKVSLEYDLPPGLPKVHGDATQVRQVVMNLVINAAEAMGDHPGTVQMRAGRFTATREHLAGMYPGGDAEPGEFVYLDVIDNGAGMDHNTLTRIFEPFFSTKFTGRGLGLAAVLGIVRTHKGALSVRSAPGSGTTFRMILPVSVVAAPEDEARSAARTEAAVAGAVLVVDDEPAVRAVAQGMLKRLGIESLAASSGEEALCAFEREHDRLSLVLMDMTMPGLRGDAVAAQMRATGTDVPIVLMSDYTESEALASVDGGTADGFLQKPFTFAELQGALQSALETTD